MLILVFWIGGCSQQQITFQSGEFNRATAQSNLDDIVLNSARASKDFPLQFTRLAKFTSDNMLKGSLSPSFPFGGDATNVFNLNPVVSWSNGVQNIEYGNLNTREGLLGLTRPLTYGELEEYYESNALVPFSLLWFISVTNVDVTAEMKRALFDNFQRICSREPHQEGCKRVHAIDAQCGPRWRNGQRLRFEAWDFSVYYNTGASKCDVLGFQGFLTVFGMSQFATESRIVKKWINKKNEAGKTVAVEVAVPAEFAQFGVPEIHALYLRQQREMQKVGTGNEPFRIKLRSPKGLIEFLGELIKLQNFHQDRYIPVAPVDFGKYAEIIVVVASSSGRPLPANVAISVSDDTGEVFYVPMPDYSTETSHLTLKTISIVSDFFNLRLTKEALPATNGLVFTAN